MNAADRPTPTNFIRQIVEQDLAIGKHRTVVTRFPPEPNGYLHIGHAKSICLNFGLAQEFGGVCHLRFDDTNPAKEDIEYVEAIERDVRWLGFDWGDKLFHASDYFQQLHDFAVHLIRAGKAYVCSLSAEETRAWRGTLTEPGRDSPYRTRSVDENLDLFARMRAGEFPDGAHVLRARIDMASPNLNLRDPVLYRIKHAPHPVTGDAWCIYPMYDYAHCVSDALEGITHSLCTLEFEDHRALYDWILDQLPVPCHPRQIEFSRLNLSYTVMSKRRLHELVEGGHVHGWDDPRLPTLSGLRRRGVPPAAIRDFCSRVGVTRKENVIDVVQLETCIREALEQSAPRALAVLRPLKVVIENYPADQTDWLDAPNHPQRPELGSRQLPFGREIYIERDDFMLDPPKDFHRLAPGREVRLRFAYFIRCERVVTDPASGEVLELICSYDPATRGGNAPDGRKVKGTIHWADARHALRAQVRLYDRLFAVPDPAGETDYLALRNPDSLQVLTDCLLEPALAAATGGYQFERLGYFTPDPDSRPDAPVWNRTVSLRDTWAKVAARG
ncbi:MAG: glutamine--tRNA ligase/YqeY domain fusion protein [Immundisolibacter sp.]|uniref:glutamine--tRNA ligase/YqeY domain fusion protein n=1 Tax=Immundisolibacter sp. TaxID=1934948 RepID=UPI0019980B93|nr:glutamine--tRNA ligase/YqeY domain fusion protein [Immundisolibacter sp.]MBC7163077.1 glutamine--tRNA ligase/YqeY domain fusion protein [Immundisolibacter sp.]